jgi:ATP-dependent DNA ligase
MIRTTQPDAIDLRRRNHLLDRLERARVADASTGVQHFDGDGVAIFKHACALGCEGIVSKRLSSLYRGLSVVRIFETTGWLN